MPPLGRKTPPNQADTPTDRLVVSLRSYVTRLPKADHSGKSAGRRGKNWSPGGPRQQPSEWVLIFDCETTTTPDQKLKFGNYQLRHKGRLFERGGGSRTTYAAAVSDALKSELGDTHRAIKTVMRWTGSKERTVKNWIAGKNGPSGEHLVILARHSDAVMAAFQQLSGRIDADRNAVQVRRKLTEAIELLDGARPDP
jgi:hypothetical protein